MTTNLVQRHVLWSYRPYQNLGQIDHNLQNHVLMASYANHQYAPFYAVTIVKFNIIFSVKETYEKEM